MKLIDIGANLLDEMYQGRYHGKQVHAADLDSVLQRSWDAGVDKIIITAGNLEEAKAALKLARTDDRLYCTVGCHPTRCGEFESYPEGPEAYLRELRKVMQEGQEDGKVVAVGECGLDYERLHFCDAATQRRYFAAQFQLASESKLPMFLHSRAAAADFFDILMQHDSEFHGGVVHSFDGSQLELTQLLERPNVYIGINGCSMKTPANLEVAAAVPSERLLLETDCPWCEIRSTHAGRQHVRFALEAKDRKKHTPTAMVKSRNEPCNIRQVLEVVAGSKGVEDLEEFAEVVWNNTMELFFRTRQQ